MREASSLFYHEVGEWVVQSLEHRPYEKEKRFIQE